jgi:hypothetical protein
MRNQAEYAINHVLAGGFLHAVLSNNSHKAVCCADVVSLAAIRQIYVYNAMPSSCLGSREKVDAGLRMRTLAEDPEVGESGEAALARACMKMAQCTDNRSVESRKKKSS